MERINFFFCFKCGNKTRKGYLRITKGLAECEVPAGGVYSSSVTSQASRAATELVPTAALVRASPIVNCSSICLACNHANESHESPRTFPYNIHFHKKLFQILSVNMLCFYSLAWMALTNRVARRGDEGREWRM